MRFGVVIGQSRHLAKRVVRDSVRLIQADTFRAFQVRPALCTYRLFEVAAPRSDSIVEGKRRPRDLGGSCLR